MPVALSPANHHPTLNGIPAPSLELYIYIYNRHTSNTLAPSEPYLKSMHVPCPWSCPLPIIIPHLNGIPAPSSLELYIYIYMAIRLQNTITCSFTNKTLQAHLRARQFKQKKEPWLAPRGLLSWPTSGREWQPWEGSGSPGGCQAPVVDKGHCTVYTIDRRRFQVPLE
jgi:hypothetical protein